MIKTGSGRGGCRRFTLVELMMVVAIIGAIAVLGIGVFNFTNYKIAETRTEGLVNKLDSVFNFMYSKYHMYPQNTDGAEGYLVLYYNPDSNDHETDLAKDGALKDFPADYCKEFAKRIDLEKLINDYGQEGENDSTSYRINDSWGRPLFYKTPGNVRTRGFDLCSAGQNGKYFKCDEPPVIGDLENMGNPEDDNNPKYGKINDGFNSDSATEDAFFSSELGDDVTNY
ncbi:MAG: type II secretion system protein [Victivallaceae bacterium]|nr:type II secretion system protein [Victivallaceae bacterium]